MLLMYNHRPYGGVLDEQHDRPDSARDGHRCSGPADYNGAVTVKTTPYVAALTIPSEVSVYMTSWLTKVVRIEVSLPLSPMVARRLTGIACEDMSRPFSLWSPG